MKTCRIAILGFGVAGKAFARILLANREQMIKDKGIEPVVVAITTGSRGALYNPEGLDLAKALKTMEGRGGFDPADPDFSRLDSLTLARTGEYDLLLELTPLNIFTGQPAADHIRAALGRGKHAVSANKGPLAWYCRELRELAKANNCCFFFETTVMAGIPIFDMADSSLQYCKVEKIEGILNATTNFILKEMGKGIAYDEILEAGRKGGFLEADPSMDTEGWDATAKLTVLMNVLMDADITPDMVDRKGITEITSEDIKAAQARGNLIKLMCRGYRAEDGSIVAKVGPEEVPIGNSFANPDLVAVVSLYTDLLGKMDIMQYGLETCVTGYGVFIDLCRVLDREK